MAGTVVFVGAGASRAFGYPVTASLFPMILQRLGAGRAFEKGGEAEQAARKRELLLRLIQSIGPGIEATRDEGAGGSIGEILSLTDYSLRGASAIAPGFLVEDLTRCRSLLEEAIIEVLNEPSLDASPDLAKRTSRWLRAHARNGRPLALVSTNYDTGLDWLYLAERARNLDDFAATVDLGFTWRECGSGRVRPRPAEPRVRLYKLHGSLNWVRCELCEHVYVNPRGRNLAERVGYGEVRDWNTCHCGHAPLRALLVAPSTIRDIRDTSLLEVWKSTLEFLRHASEWILIGYSMPLEDVGIRSLLIRASLARESAGRPAVRVIQKSTGDEARDRDTEKRYHALFPHCEYSLDGLEGFIDREAGRPRPLPRGGVRDVPNQPDPRPGANPR